ncbi:hypothetical protein CTA2_3622 [Colletotrichum tanaceti]|uniref:Uncharacterized protein n=1 Tax=Colletotrichum tanaceti TaxID=1306861 RepID=A0A4U6XRH2_9PEZI|nr:hypothetical protein CTA2_3622 [Colletotrichum tanaceti]TKW58309.1 hypothetical protein CTA1_12135 [Colletotrichum tanaceti]
MRFLGDPEYASDRREALQPFQSPDRAAEVSWEKFDLVLADDSLQWMETQKIYILWDRGPLNVYLRPVVRS